MHKSFLLSQKSVSTSAGRKGIGIVIALLIAIHIGWSFFADLDIEDPMFLLAAAFIAWLFFDNAENIKRISELENIVDTLERRPSD